MKRRHRGIINQSVNCCRTLLKFLARSGFAVLAAAIVSSASAETAITLARSDVAVMAKLWETDTVTVSPLVNAQYPQFSGDWQFIFPHSTISDDGDIHVDMALDPGGTGANGNNIGASPLICEVTNASATQLKYLTSLTRQRANFHGIFRFYTEHTSERHFELHPVTQLYRWNGSSFVGDADYHGNITSVADGQTHTTATLAHLLDGSQKVGAVVRSDGAAVDFTFPSPSVNYVQYDGIAVSSVTTDETSSYFLFRPNLVPASLVRCRLVASTAAYNAAGALRSGQALSVNALTRTDMEIVGQEIAPLLPQQSKTFPRPVEFITLALPTVGPTPVQAQLLNVSTRVSVGAGDDAAIAGFVITGSTPKKVLLRSLGPSLGAVAVDAAVVDPAIELHDASGAAIATNDNWKDTQRAEIEATGIPPADDRESAIVQSLSPGAYTVVMRDKAGTDRIGLVEVYDLSAGPDQQIANLSTRGVVGANQGVMIAGFIIGSSDGGAARVLVRGLGPSLPLASDLRDPALELHDANGGLIATNDNWRDTQRLEILATGIPPPHDLEAAIARTLPAGNYTAVMQDRNGATGAGLLEIYHLR